MRNKILTTLLFLIFCSFNIVLHAQTTYTIDSLIVEDHFNTLQSQWIIETNSASPTTSIFVKDGKLITNVNGGATVWLNKKLEGNFLIECKRKVVMQGGSNDRLSDFNFFWMANDPQQKSLFNHKGIFSDYDSLQLYYAGIGGNQNTTTRFRKYEGNGAKTILKEYTDAPHLLQPNKEYSVRILIKDGVTACWIDDELYFTYNDPQPYTSGFFAFRVTKSNQEYSDFKVYRVK